MLGSGWSCEAVEWVVQNIQHHQCPPHRLFLFVLQIDSRSHSKWPEHSFLCVLALWKRGHLSTPKQGTAGSRINLRNHLKGWCSLKLCEVLVWGAQHKDVTASWPPCSCEQNILIEIELKKSKITEQIVCSHIILTGDDELLLCSLSHLPTQVFTCFLGFIVPVQLLRCWGSTVPVAWEGKSGKKINWVIKS